MPLRAVRAPASLPLWQAFVDGLLSDLGSHTGPDGYAAQAWLTHRLQRDRLYHDAAARGLKGWLAPPIRFFSELPQIFDITRRPVSVLERHIALDRIARKEADAIGLSEDGLDRPGMGRAADRFLGDLLPELASPADLGRLLHVPGADPFGKKRNEWIIRTGQAWLHELDRMGKYDPRSIHALVADAIGAGGLPQALKGARRLHIYGLTTTRTRGRLLQALADQAEVEVVLYLLESEEADEFEPLVPQPTSSSAPSAPSALSAVIPAPDEQRELEYIALRIKQLVTEDRVPLDDIAVVARTGREDARLAYSVLENAGIPATARIRTAFDQVPAIKAVLALLRGAALGWPYRALRQLLESSYFDLKVDLRAIDYLATERRIEGLDQWVARLRGLITRIDVESDDAQKAGLRKGQVTRDADALTAFRDQAARLDGERPVTEWLALTREMLEPGWFDFRKRLCQEVGGRWDVVRLDQQGVDALDEMLREWQGAESGGDAVTAAEWYETLRRFLANNEIALSTPLRTGVQILEAHEAALIPFAHTFVIHANDGEFPKRPGSGGLYSDEERRHQAGLGLGIADRDRQLLRERALWRAVTAGPAVTITYRTADPAGVPLLPSLMVPAHDETTAIPRTRFTWDPPFTPHHADRLATARLPEPVRVPDPLPIRLAILHAYAESRRLGSADGTRPPGELDPWNGLLRDPVVLEKLGTRFGPERPWSPSALEQYAQNPFLFLLERVLYLEEKFEAEEDITPMARGGVIHSVLERFYEKYPGPFPASLSGDTETLYHAVADQVFREVEDAGDWLGLEAIWQVKREEIRQTVRDFLAWELEKFAGWTPHARELSFGMDGAEPATVSGTDITGTPATMLLRGRIDRVDVRQAFGPEHRVVDYKSGTIPETKYYADGAALQGPIYLAALASRGMTPAEAVYLSVKHQKAGAGVSWDSDQARHALRIALTIPGRVRAGIFEPAAAKSLGEWVKYWAGGPAMFRKTAVRKESRFG